MFIRDDMIYQFKNRAQTVLNVGNVNFKEVKYFYDFLEENSLFKGLLKGLESIDFDVKTYIDEMKAKHNLYNYPERHEEKIILFNYIIRAFLRKEIDENYFMGMMKNSPKDLYGGIINKFFIPVYDYFCERIKSSENMLYLLDRYRHRTEWFHKERLLERIKSKRNREDILTKDLQEYLHNQGIDFPFSTPSSPSGEVDLVGLIDTSNPLVLEVKLFDLESSYDKKYIRQGLWQAYKYARDYGKPIGYLLIFNLDKRDIEFEMLDGESVKSIQIGGKIIYILCVNLYKNEKSASKSKVEVYIIEDNYLKKFLDEEPEEHI